MKFAFITGMGRSGTKLVAELLNQSPHAASQHECIGNREFWLLSWYLPHDNYSELILAEEKIRIEKKFNSQLFIDVNSRLQNCVPALHKIFDPVEVFHLVRNPKEVVRSIYTRRIEENIHLVPKSKTELKKWMESDKLSQICWNWKNATENLLREKTTLIRFEDLISNYESFSRLMGHPLGLDISEEIWMSIANKKVNRTRSKLFRWAYARWKGKSFVDDELPPFEQWTSQNKERFYDICGDTMRKCGYA